LRKLLKDLKKMGYIVSVGYKGSNIMLTTKGENINFENLGKTKAWQK